MSKFIVDQIKAENLLKGADILDQINKLCANMKYRDGDDVISFETMFNRLRTDVEKLPSVKLDSTISRGSESKYLVELMTSLEHVLDETERLLVRGLWFSGKLKGFINHSNNLLATFSAWYIISLADTLSTTGVKLSAASQKALAESEYSRLMDGADLDQSAMLEAVEIMVDMLKSHKKLAQEKYQMGKDQVNMSLSNFDNVNAVGQEPSRLTRGLFPNLKDKYTFVEESDDDDFTPKYEPPVSKAEPAPEPEPEPVVIKVEDPCDPLEDEYVQIYPDTDSASVPDTDDDDIPLDLSAEAPVADVDHEERLTSVITDDFAGEVGPAASKTNGRKVKWTEPAPVVAVEEEEDFTPKFEPTAEKSAEKVPGRTQIFKKRGTPSTGQAPQNKFDDLEDVL